MLSGALAHQPDISDAADVSPADAHRLRAGWEIGPSTLINSQTPRRFWVNRWSFTFQRQLGGTWGIAILAILVDRQRSSGQPPRRIADHFSLATQDALHDGAAALQPPAFPFAGRRRRIALLHARCWCSLS